MPVGQVRHLRRGERRSSVLARHATAIPKAADGTVKMILTIKVAKDVAVRARTSAKISLKPVLVNAPTRLKNGAREMVPVPQIGSAREIGDRGGHG